MAFPLVAGERPVPNELRQAIHAWDGLLEGLPVAVYVCDARGAIVQFNQRAAELWGRAPALGDTTERFCGSHKLYFDGYLTSRDDTPMARVLATGEPIHGVEGVLERPDGSRRTVVITSAEAVDGMQVQVMRDETEIEAVRRARDHVLANIAHEFRTPLAAQLASIELARRADGATKTRPFWTRDRETPWSQGSGRVSTGPHLQWGP